MPQQLENTMKLPDSGDGTGQSISASTSSAATSNVIGGTTAYVYSTVEAFLVKGPSPTATVASGLPIGANQSFRISGLDAKNDKIAAITSTGTGTVYIRPGF